jgi:hypothetical protein
MNVDVMVNGFCPSEGEEFCSGSCPMPDFAVICVETFFYLFRSPDSCLFMYVAAAKTVHSWE